MADNTENNHRVFVYGTLMRGGRNDSIMKGRFLSEVTTVYDCFLMVQFNSTSTRGAQTPGVYRGGHGYIWGEVYEVDDAGLAVLDQLEQNGVLYQREEVLLQDGTQAWMYILIADKEPSDLQDRVLYSAETKTYKWDRQEPVPK